ncbi:MAG: type II-A CRISPR-associated protein Csn2 [Bacillota bacterium]|nr:type II-A CRISPR-associated protein Csn2 [Bacillota bacterium]
MNLLYKPFSLSMSFNENIVNVLAIESPSVLEDFCRAIFCPEDSDGNLILSELDRELSITKMIDTIYNPFQVSLRDKKIINGLYKILSQEENEKVIEYLAGINQDCIALLDELSEQNGFSIEYNLNIDVTSILKMYDVHIAEEPTDFVGKLYNYVMASNRICGYTKFCFFGLRYYLTTQQLKEFYKTCHYQKIDLLIVEPRYAGQNEYEKCWIIDENQCIIEV